MRRANRMQQVGSEVIQGPHQSIGASNIVQRVPVVNVVQTSRIHQSNQSMVASVVSHSRVQLGNQSQSQNREGTQKIIREVDRRTSPMIAVENQMKTQLSDFQLRQIDTVIDENRGLRR